MKYWWLEKYQNFKRTQLTELIQDVNYFVIVPRNYEAKYQVIKNKRIQTMEEPELLIAFKYLVNNHGNLLSLKKIIQKLLEYPDNSFPASDYNLKEMLEEVQNLYKNLPLQTKLEHNNIAICYHCLNVYYVDKIINVNKLNLCLCPYCSSNKLYFDNDYIPMNYTFIKLAQLYYHKSSLGCSFLEYQKIMKKNVKIVYDANPSYSLDFTDLFSEKFTPLYEKKFSKKIYDILTRQDRLLNRKESIYIPDIEVNISNQLILFIVSLIEILSSTIFLKEITIVTSSKKLATDLKSLLKIIIDFSY